VTLSAFAVVTGLAVIVTLCRERTRSQGSATAVGSLVAFALLLPALMIGSGTAHELSILLAVAALGWLVARIARRPGGARLGCRLDPSVRDHPVGAGDL